MKIIILAGGSGTRLWPISRSNYPKQFLKLAGYKYSLFQMTIRRAIEVIGGVDGNLCLQDIIIVTNDKYKHIIMGQIEEMNLSPVLDNILIEPESKNTLPAITYAVSKIENDDENILVLSSDHIIDNVGRFTCHINNIELEILNRYILLFGIKPDKAHTGYGYISYDYEGRLNFGKSLDSIEVHPVKKFIEKPEESKALEYLNKGYLWNSGMFMFSKATFLKELKEHSDQVYTLFMSMDEVDAFARVDNISIDYGLIEKTRNIAVLPIDISWSDLGSFDSLQEEYEREDNEARLENNEISIDSKGNFIYNNSNKEIALIGVEDLIVVQEKDALLISKRDQTQKVKDVVKLLEKQNSRIVEEHVTIYRPWGSYTILEEGFFYKIKRITVHPEKKLSYQMHHHRSEHWIVVKGTAKVTIEGEERVVISGESTFVKAGHKHRLENPGKTLLEVIEVQLGEYLEEDDIIRLDDDFGRI